MVISMVISVGVGWRGGDEGGEEEGRGRGRGEEEGERVDRGGEDRGRGRDKHKLRNEVRRRNAMACLICDMVVAYMYNYDKLQCSSSGGMLSSCALLTSPPHSLPVPSLP